MVFFDIGGVMYDDTVYARSWVQALREMGAEFTDEEFEAEYAAARAAQSESFRRRLTRRFLGEDQDLAPVEARASKYWSYPATALYPDTIAVPRGDRGAATDWGSSRTSRPRCAPRWIVTASPGSSRSGA